MHLLAHHAPWLLPVSVTPRQRRYAEVGLVPAVWRPRRAELPAALFRLHAEVRVATAVYAPFRLRHFEVGVGAAVPALCRRAKIGIVARFCSGVIKKARKGSHGRTLNQAALSVSIRTWKM